MDDYESLPEGSSVISHVIAGASAGMFEHVLVYPFDSVKTRLQCIRPIQGVKFSGVTHGLYHIFFKEGIKHTLKGVGAVIAGAGPAHALYFASYEFIKSSLSKPSFSYMNNFAFGISGAVATTLHDSIMTPADAIKHRLQLYQSPYRNSYHCLKTVIKNEGVGVLYRAYTTQLMMNLPYHSLYIIVYENSLNYLNPKHQYLPLTHILAASTGAAISSFLTNPIDVCKTVLNTQDHCALSDWSDKKIKLRGFRDAFYVVYKYEGFKGYFRGVTARIMYAVPGTSISWGTYEMFKHYLNQNKTSPDV